MLEPSFALAALFVGAGLAAGCATTTDGALESQAADRSEPVTFSNQVVRLMQDNGQSCHKPDGHAPFSLLIYADAKAHTLPGNLGRDVFRQFVIPTDFDAERFLTSFEARPGQGQGTGLARVIHHVTLFIDPTRAVEFPGDRETRSRIRTSSTRRRSTSRTATRPFTRCVSSRSRRRRTDAQGAAPAGGSDFVETRRARNCVGFFGYSVSTEE